MLKNISIEAPTLESSIRPEIKARWCQFSDARPVAFANFPILNLDISDLVKIKPTSVDDVKF